MSRFFYTSLMYLLQPFILLFMGIRSLKSPNYRKRLGERYGLCYQVRKPVPHGVIIHAASVGEVIAATPLVRLIQREYPHLPITVTTVTPTGSERVNSAFGQSVTHMYLPYDLPDALNRFLDFVQPKACIVIETEIWPNLIRQLYQRQTPFIIANARLSPRSAKRYGWVKHKLQNMLNEITLIAPQDSTSGQRYLALGYDEKNLKLTGNIKYDLVLSSELLSKVKQLKAQIGSRPVWVAGSTHEGEDEIILEAHRTLLATFPNLLLILSPRHPERFNSVADMLHKRKFCYCRRSTNDSITAQTNVLLGDTMGELMTMYGVSDVAFVGGSLVKHGGHNPLEPLAFKLPVISGKYVFNFPDVFDKLLQVHGVLLVNENAKAISSAVSKYLRSPALRERYGYAGYDVLVENQGALQRLFALLRPYLEK
ncbi:lipid IV(A) 3-deoxy-D-manno-octulosonic acid transferase [Conservatibacter flavescens]|uniref:3-deoxy-D-manno-octulosonic acid transferase n=1 Tax=Conservatibacter flavescens TaxID=28161 RepID=A0A2M8S368_9PAST|nr:lipid IV(A) 3-deoxy-D-manno-octulosonic acid transferase [Conservatibacter flavescens]PJG85538.1 3-deoxy-D-manno-octulosonic acid transferase [Conservatibacter flavescens]